MMLKGLRRCILALLFMAGASGYAQINNQINYTYESSLITDNLAGNGALTGYDVEINGNDLFVSQTGTRSVLVFSRTSATAPWTLVKRILQSDSPSSSTYGNALAASGDYLVVGDETNGQFSYNRYGKVYVYHRNAGGPGNWGQVKILQASDKAHDDYFGSSVDIDGNRIVVGAKYGKAAYLFEKDWGGTDNWGERRIFVSSSSTTRLIGESVQIHGTTLFAGGGWYASGHSSNYGEVLIFDKDNGGLDNWGLTKSILAGRSTFGSVMDYDGTTLAVGAPRYIASGASTHPGHVFLFSRNTGGPNNWGQVKQLEGSNTADLVQFGRGVAIDNNHLLVGALPIAPFSEQVYRFDQNLGGAGNWGQYGLLLASDLNFSSSGFDRVPGLQGNEFYVGAFGALFNGVTTGKVYRYHVSDCYTTFTQLYDTIYYDEALPFGNRMLRYQGQYLDTLTTANGCDSVLVMNLKVRSKINFENKWDFGSGNGTFDVALGDLNADGKPDMVSANYSGGSISIFQNQTAAGVINPATFMPSFALASGTTTTGVEIVDVDGDGKKDIISSSYGRDSVYVFRNIGAPGGTLNAAYFAPRVAFLAGNGPKDIDIADFDGDGKTDLAALNYLDQSVSVLLNTSTPGVVSFGTKLDNALFSNGESMAIGDLNGDGKPDIGVTLHSMGSLAVLENQSVPGGLYFIGPEYIYSSGGNPGGLAISDFNQDNCTDIVHNQYSSGFRVSTYRSNCAPGNILETNYTQEIVHRYTAITSSVYGYVTKLADLDLNGQQDVIFTSMSSTTNGVARFMANINNGDAVLDSFDFNTAYTKSYTTSLTGQPSYNTFNSPINIRLGDIDSDGRPDLCVTNYGNNKVMVFKNSSLQAGTTLSDTIGTTLSSGTTYCSGTSLPVLITTNRSYAAGNAFVVQLSDASGQFTNPTVIGVFNTSLPGSYTCNLPTQLPYGTGYRIRVVSTSPYLVGDDNGINITIRPSGSQTQTITACNSYTWPANGMTYTSSGTITHTLTNHYGCDSTIVLHLTIRQNTGSSQNISACSSYTWPVNGTTYTSSGTYSATLPNAAGCDSTITLHLTINGGSSGSQTISACNTYTWPANNQTYTASGTYTATLTNHIGCDSLVTLHLTIRNSSSASATVYACNSYTWPVNGNTYTSSGTYNATIPNAAGCDSNITLNLILRQHSSAIQNRSACGSYTWPVNGNTYTASGTYNATIPNAAGCDSNITLILTIRQHTSATQTVNTCGSYTWPVNGTTYTASGTYSATILNAAGCDSNITLNLTLRQHTSATQTMSACGSYTWPVNGTTYTASGTYNATIPNAAGCDSNITLILILRQHTSATQTVNTCGSYTWPVNGTTYTASGTYNATIPNAAGCDSNITLSLTIRQHSSATQTMSACGSYTWPVNGTTYTASGTYNTTIPNAAGCDSNITLNLTLRQHTSATQTMSACGSYTWHVNGTTYTASGTYNATIPNAAGCDSNITLSLTIRQHTSATQTMSACGSYTWPVNGTTYTASGTYSATITNAAGCDSNITLNLTIRQHTSATQTTSACGSYTWPVNGTTYTASGTYNATIPNAAGCDSNITLSLTIRQHTSATQTMSACGSYTWPVNGTTYTASGTYSATITNAAGCDSNITLNLTIRQHTSATQTTSACGSYTWPVNGTTYTASGTYNATIPNAAGCDSNITLNLTIRQHTSATQTLSACGSYTWPVNGTTYTASGTYNATIPNAAGCDSNITLILILRQHTSATQTMSACGSYTWPVNGTTYTASGTYSATIPNAAGCDSNITLNLTIRQHTSATQTMSACGSYTWPVNGTTYTSSGTYNATIPNAAGCDSNITLNLTLRQHSSATQTMSACDSYTWPVNGNTYTSSGTYNATIPNAAGCDSNITLNLTIRQNTSATQTMSACGSYTWPVNGTTYTSSGTYNATIPNAAGCDSNITLNLTIRQHTSATQTVNTCGSYIWPVNGTTYTASGTYNATIPNAAGCDSNITLILTIRQHTSATQTVNTCGSYTWPVNGTTYNSSGTYSATIPNAAGCDSNITLNLTLRQHTSATQTMSACGSYTWPVNGTTYTASGTYNATIPNAAGCDSNITLNLTIRQHTSATQTLSACGSYTWPVNGTTYTSSGTYNATLPNAAGCDSNITLILTIRQHTSATQIMSACGSYTWPVNGTTYTASGTYSATIPNAAGCDSNITLNLTIRQHTSATQTLSACGSYTWPVNGTTYTSSGTYNATIPNAAGCDSNITLSLILRQHTSATQTVNTCGSYTWPVNGTTYTASGTYSATIPNAAGCDSNITLNLTLRQHTSATQTMSACGSYTWPVNGTTYTASGTYNATIPNAAGCDSNITLNLTINTIDNSVVQQNDSTLTAQASGVTYQWIDCLTGNPLPGETNATFVASVNGSYAVILDDNGCTDTSDCIVISNLDVPWISIGQVSVYPNPSYGLFTLAFQQPLHHATVTVYDIAGKRIYTTLIQDTKEISLDIRTALSGLYFVVVEDEHYHFKTSVIKIGEP